MKGYADLLREAQARQNAEARADRAEAKLAQVAEWFDTCGLSGPAADRFRRILEPDA